MENNAGEMLSPYGGSGRTTNNIIGVHWI